MINACLTLLILCWHDLSLFHALLHRVACVIEIHRVKMRLHLFFCGVALLFFDVGGKLIDAPSKPLLYTDLDQDYRIYQRKVKWEDALAFCSKCYGGFATFENPLEARKVQLQLYNISYFNEEYYRKNEKNEWGLDRRYWFGLTDNHRVPPGRKKRAAKKPAVWKWIKKPADTVGTPAVTIKRYPWYLHQPDHDKKKTQEHCGGFWNPGYHIDKFKNGDPQGKQEFHSFNDIPCDHKYYFICKKSEDPDAPTDPSCTANKAPDPDAGEDEPPPEKRSLLKEKFETGGVGPSHIR